MRVEVGGVDTFKDVSPDKAQAVKVLEESAEVFGSWQGWDRFGRFNDKREDLLDECADVIQATLNLVAALGVEDFKPYMSRCRSRNEERGRM